MYNKDRKFPTASEIQNNIYDYSEPYPYKIPENDTCEYPYPKALCKYAEYCKVKDDFSDYENISKNCKYSEHDGCPLYILKFNVFDTFSEIKNIPIFEIGQIYSADFTVNDLLKLVENFNILKNYHEVPIGVFGHDENQKMLEAEGLPAAGWITNLVVRGKRLYADIVDIPKKVYELLQKNAYKHISAEIYRNFKYGDNKKDIGPVLRRVAFLGYDIPKIKGLDSILANYSENTNDINSASSAVHIEMSNDLITFFSEVKNMSLLQKFKCISSSKFSIGDSIETEDKKSKGKIIALSEDTITLDASNVFKTGDTFQNESKTIGIFAEESIPAPYDKNFGIIKARICKVLDLDTPDIVNAAILAAVAGRNLTAQQKKILQTGWPDIHGEPDSEFTAMKTSYPYPKPAKYIEGAKKEEDEKTKAMHEEQLKKYNEVIAENEKLKLDLKAQKETISTQESRISSIENSRKEDLRLAHFKEVQLFSEQLKNTGVSSALLDDTKFGQFILSLDWNTPIKFAEGKDPLTFYAQAKEVFSEILKLAKDNKLFVPIGTKIENTNDVKAPNFAGYDPEGYVMNQKILEFAEKNKVSYDKAYDMIINEEIEKNKKNQM